MASKGYLAHEEKDNPRCASRSTGCGRGADPDARRREHRHGLWYPVRGQSKVYPLEQWNRQGLSYEPNGKPIPPHTYVSFAKALLSQWMNSPHHKENILIADARYMGSACAPSRDDGDRDFHKFYCAQEFFTPMPGRAEIDIRHVHPPTERSRRAAALYQHEHVEEVYRVTTPTARTSANGCRGSMRSRALRIRSIHHALLEQLARNDGFSAGSGSTTSMRWIGFIRIPADPQDHGDWLLVAKDAQGRGIMTMACRALVDHAFDAWKLNRVEIRSAAGNQRSRAVAKRWDSSKKACSDRASRFATTFHDSVVYGCSPASGRRRGRRALFPLPRGRVKRRHAKCLPFAMSC
jgi:GNAT superfamily N-acetyltransferase